MKNRTIEEIHDKYIGHKNFANFVDKAIEEGHNVTDIKEYNGKFKFKLDDLPLEFDKNPKVNWRWQLDQCYSLLWYKERLKGVL